MRGELEWAKLEDQYYGLGHPTTIEGYTCVICGAAVPTAAQQKHIEWHELLRNEVQNAAQAGVYYGNSSRW
ncbi:hypothetical protein SEA_MOLIVIA_70 [Arthrobacter phage Molivia]|uniref:Uncharacterized protein n=1 Tax=Arthrobacter phage Molivia TaxID=2015839 RepID=A0A286S2D5_9CAUD|nr:hypothetical protein FDI28_gp46 [Arthrobacter phage Molivia]ASX99292.1 hypothetical protein SEA_MOLIVIA_70 [Arthrobacter phage Molivia]